ncbi:MAG: UDP-N-acetylmuramoyl-tripeptide--D-alanyl-D-alanine ligase [Oscillospiraceae bacterium]|nr:UDP-N-acetylmuramoyl-tripeptide--D-alanyl-D-alanine ligase [Oscillospiraceae bacterium]
MDLSVIEIAKATGGELLYSGDKTKAIKNIVTDSRKILPDSLFFARKGENFDGHEFVAQALENGAIGAVVRKDSVKLFTLHDKNAAIIEVEDTAQALLDLAKYYKKSFKNIRLTVAVTGSVGKTTTKEFIYSVLGEKFKTQKSEGNLNTETGLPFTVFSLCEDTKALVLEMGTSAFGEIRRLSRAANPETAVITNIGTSHIESFGSREGIKKAKLEILEGMEAGSNIIFNADDPLLYAEKNKTGKKEYFFGIKNKKADFVAEHIEFDYNAKASSFALDKFNFEIPALGAHNIYNALPAVIAGKIYGLKNEEIQSGLNKFENAKMRQNIYDHSGVTIIDDCYNSSLESVLAAFEVLSEMAKKTKGRAIAVLSDILEAGDYSRQIHEKIGAKAAEKNISLYLFGEESKATYDAFVAERGGKNCDAKHSTDKSNIAAFVVAEAKKGDVALFKASRGMAMETVLEEFKTMYGG